MSDHSFMAAVVTASPAPLAVVQSACEPLISFITVAYGTGPIIVDSLASLVAALADTELTWEYIVVDNRNPAAPDRTWNELRLSTHGVFVVRADSNLGFGGGCELGALQARGKVLAFVNPDTFFAAGWIEPLVAQLDDPTTSIAAPVLLEPDGTLQEAGQQLFADGTTQPCMTMPETGTVRRHDYASAACWLIRRDEHERVGGFDPAYSPAYFEDVDLGRRAAALGGGCVVVADARVIHRRGSSTTDTSLPDLTSQLETLLSRWPEIRWTQAKASV